MKALTIYLCLSGLICFCIAFIDINQEEKHEDLKYLLSVLPVNIIYLLVLLLGWLVLPFIIIVGLYEFITGKELI